MNLERPKLPGPMRVQVVARDPETGKSRTRMVYGTTPADFIKLLESNLSPSPRRRKPEKTEAA